MRSKRRCNLEHSIHFSTRCFLKRKRIWVNKNIAIFLIDMCDSVLVGLKLLHVKEHYCSFGHCRQTCKLLFIGASSKTRTRRYCGSGTHQCLIYRATLSSQTYLFPPIIYHVYTLFGMSHIVIALIHWQKDDSMWMSMLLERVLNVDYKIVFKISINKPRENLVDIILLDDLNLWIDFVRCTEVNHFLDVFCTSNNTTRQGPRT